MKVGAHSCILFDEVKCWSHKPIRPRPIFRLLEDSPMKTNHRNEQDVDKNIDWDLAARYYDAFVRVVFDIHFFLGQARSSGGPVLELMCGTGRITMPLAESGIPITALDSSTGLLARLRSKLAGRDLPVRLVEADARHFDLGEKFSLVFIGFNAFAELLGQDDRLKAMKAVRAHLAHGGRFLLTLHNPPIRVASAHAEWRPMGGSALGPGLTLDVSSRWDVDHVRERITGVQKYRELNEQEECVKEVSLPIVFDLVTSAEVSLLAEITGLRIIEVYGDYDGSAFDEARSPYMIFTMVPLEDD